MRPAKRAERANARRAATNHPAGPVCAGRAGKAAEPPPAA